MAINFLKNTFVIERVFFVKGRVFLHRIDHRFVDGSYSALHRLVFRESFFSFDKSITGGWAKNCNHN